MGALDSFRSMTLEGLDRNEQICWASPEEVRDALITLIDTVGGGTLLINFNLGAMPDEMFVRNLQRFGEEVLPALQAHQVTTVPID